MTSWYARNSLMPSTSARASKNADIKTTEELECRTLHQSAENRVSHPICGINLRNSATSTMKETTRNGTDNVSMISNLREETNAGLVTRHPLAGVRVGFNGHEMSQMSDVTMTQSRSLSSQGGSGRGQPSIASYVPPLGQESIISATKSLISSTSVGVQSKSSCFEPSSCVHSACTKSGQGSYSAISSALHRNAALSWRPARFRQKIPLVSPAGNMQQINGSTSRRGYFIPNELTGSYGTGDQSIVTGGNAGKSVTRLFRQASNYDAIGRHPLGVHANADPSFRVSSDVHRLPQGDNSASNMSQHQGMATHSNWSESENMSSRLNNRTLHGSRNASTNRINENALERVSQMTNESNGGQKAVLYDGTEVQRMLNSRIDQIIAKEHKILEMLDKVNAKESEITTKLGELDEKAYGFHRRLVSAEEDHAQQFREDVNRRMTENEQERKQLEFLFKNHIHELDVKAGKLKKSVCSAEQNHFKHVTELGSMKSDMEKTCSKVQRMLVNVENSATKISSLAEATLNTIKRAQSNFFDSTYSLIKVPVTQLVETLFKDRMATAPHCSPRTPQAKTIAEAEGCIERNSPLPQHVKSLEIWLPKTPARSIKRKLEEVSGVTRRLMPKRKCKGKSIGVSSSRLPISSSPNTRAKVGSSLTDTKKLNFCVTPCERETMPQIIPQTNLLAIDDRLKPEQYQKASKSHINHLKTSRRTFGNARGRINVIDDEFSFL